jgi:preprotein translocase subunit YajC
MTTSGMYGTIVALADNTVDLEIAPRVVTTWSRAAVRERLTATDGGAKTESEVTADEPDNR